MAPLPDPASGSLSAPALERLFSPLPLGRITLRNRIVSPPHGTGFADGGLPSDRQVAYFEARAQGGVGLIVVGSLHVYPPQWAFPGENLAEDPRAVPGYRRIADAVHAHGTAIVGQLHFSGRQIGSAALGGPVLAASPLASPQVREVPKELEAHEIEDLIDHFGLSAANVVAGGFDGVEVFSSQGYGLNQFLSAATNHRDDRWGGPLESRMRLLLAVVRRVRDAVGPDPLVGVRLSMDDLVEGGLTLAESCQVAAALEASGCIDYINASAASSKDWPLWIGDSSVPRGTFVPLTEEFRKATSLPLAIATRIKDPVHAEEILAGGTVDMIGMNRALIADPDLPRKARAGRLAEIRPCINANQGCLNRILGGLVMGCTVNPVAGLERELGAVEPAAAPRRVAVAGGGPAGMQAALVAAQRGHSVTLFEKGGRLGGQIRLAAHAPARRELVESVDWLEREARRAGVDVRLGTEATPERLAGFDAVVLATGSTPVRTGFASFRPAVRAIPGHDLPHVLTAWEALGGGAADGTAATGARVLVAEDDPHVNAVTVAEALAARGRHVTLVTRNAQAGLSIGAVSHEFLYKRLYGAGVEILTSTWVDAIAPGQVTCSNVHSGAPVTVAADTVVLCTGNAVEDGLYRALGGHEAAVELHRVGDCLAPRKLDDAIREGFLAGRAL